MIEIVLNLTFAYMVSVKKPRMFEKYLAIDLM